MQPLRTEFRHWSDLVTGVPKTSHLELNVREALRRVQGVRKRCGLTRTDTKRVILWYIRAAASGLICKCITNFQP